MSTKNVERVRPITSTEREREANEAHPEVGAELHAQEVHTTSDQQRIFRKHIYIGGTVDHGTVTSAAEMVALGGIAGAGSSVIAGSAPRGVWPGDTCWRSDESIEYRCISGKNSSAVWRAVLDLATVAPAQHTHTAADLPATMPPSAHTHAISGISGLQAALDAKQNNPANATTLARIGESGGLPLWNDGPWPGGGSGGGSGGSPTAIDSTSLRHWWPLNDFHLAPRKSLADNTNGQLASNGNVGVDFGFLETKRSARFSGANYLSRASNSTLQIGSGSFSVTLWVCPAVVANAGLVLKSEYATNNVEFAVLYYGGYFSFQLRNSANTATNACNAVSAGAASAGVWYHVASVYDSSAQEIRIYINNSLSNTVAHTGGIRNGTARMLFGANGINATTQELFLNGWLAEVSLWGRVLTAAEITTLYGSGGGAVWPFTAP